MNAKVCLSCLTSKLYLTHRAVGQKETIHRFTTFYYTLKDPLGSGWRRRSVWQLKIWHIHGDHGRLALCKWILRFVSVGCHGTRTVNVTGWTKYESILPRQLLVLAIWPALKRTYSVFCANSLISLYDRIFSFQGRLNFSVPATFLWSLTGLWRSEANAGLCGTARPGGTHEAHAAKQTNSTKQTDKPDKLCLVKCYSTRVWSFSEPWTFVEAKAMACKACQACSHRRWPELSGSFGSFTAKLWKGICYSYVNPKILW